MEDLERLREMYIKTIEHYKEVLIDLTLPNALVKSIIEDMRFVKEQLDLINEGRLLVTRPEV